jgi:hypothetical protein
MEFYTSLDGAVGGQPWWKGLWTHAVSLRLEALWPDDGAWQAPLYASVDHHELVDRARGKLFVSRATNPQGVTALQDESMHQLSLLAKTLREGKQGAKSPAEKGKAATIAPATAATPAPELSAAAAPGDAAASGVEAASGVAAAEAPVCASANAAATPAPELSAAVAPGDAAASGVEAAPGDEAAVTPGASDAEPAPVTPGASAAEPAPEDPPEHEFQKNDVVMPSCRQRPKYDGCLSLVERVNKLSLKLRVLEGACADLPEKDQVFVIAKVQCTLDVVQTKNYAKRWAAVQPRLEACLGAAEAASVEIESLLDEAAAEEGVGSGAA